MTIMKITSLSILFLLSVLLFSCGKDDDDKKATTGKLTGVITDYISSETLTDVHIIVFNATTNAPTDFSGVTDSEGSYSFDLEPGVYYLKLSKQGYTDIPAIGVSPVTVTVELDTEVESNYKMQQSAVLNGGYITGTVTSEGNGLGGVLVVASNGTIGCSSVTDADGNYYIYNVPAGTYSVQGLIAGYNSIELNIEVVENTENSDSDIELTTGATGILSGSVTFLATENGIVDVTLTHPLTKETIPGLTTETVGTTYTLNNIPDGTYIARASYANDTYVVDPDWIVKNGEPVVTLDGSATTLDFSVTGAVEVVSPASDTETAKPAEITETAPVFTWTAYSSVSDYIIEVSDVNGNVIWGGFTNESGTITKNIIIAKSQLSIQYNADGNASEELQEGNTYRWKVYASKDDTKEATGWKLISVSEEQKGLFTIKSAIE